MTENTPFENVLFPPGQIVATPRALAALEDSGQMPAEFLSRHLSGDWGKIHPEDRGMNEAALKDGSRIFSVYNTSKGERLWVLTEGDRSVTTILLPEDY